MMRIKFNSPQDCGLIVQQSGNPQQVLVRFLNLMLNYQCGLALRIANSVEEGIGIAELSGAQVRCVFLIQNFDLEVDLQLENESIASCGHRPLVDFPHQAL